MLVQITINEWACENCHDVFYTYLEKSEDAKCPRCSDPAQYCGEATFILRDRKFEDVIEEVLEQECSNKCWVYSDSVTEHTREEVEAVIGECAVAKLLKAIYGAGCPVK